MSDGVSNGLVERMQQEDAEATHLWRTHILAAYRQLVLALGKRDDRYLVEAIRNLEAIILYWGKE